MVRTGRVSLGRNVRRSWLRWPRNSLPGLFRFIDGYRPVLGTVLLQVNDRWSFVHTCGEIAKSIAAKKPGGPHGNATAPNEDTPRSCLDCCTGRAANQRILRSPFLIVAPVKFAVEIIGCTD